MILFTVFGSATVGALVAGLFAVVNAVSQRRHDSQRGLDEARRLAYAQFISAAAGFVSLNGRNALAPESDAQLRTAYGATVLLGSPQVQEAADILFAAAWNEAGPHAVEKVVRDEFIKVARKDIF